MGPLHINRPHPLDVPRRPGTARCLGFNIQRLVSGRQEQHCRIWRKRHRGSLHISRWESDAEHGLQHRQRKDFHKIWWQSDNNEQRARLPRSSHVLERGYQEMEHDSRCRTADEHLLVWQSERLEVWKLVRSRIRQSWRCMGMPGFDEDESGWYGWGEVDAHL